MIIVTDIVSGTSMSICIVSVLGIYPDCNFTDDLGGWANQGDRAWIIVNSTTKDVGLLTGRQGTSSN